MILPTSQMRKRKHREAKLVDQGHTVSKTQSCNLNPDRPDPYYLPVPIGEQPPGPGSFHRPFQSLSHHNSEARTMISIFQMNKLSFISLETSLTHGISGFQLFGEFPVAFLVLISSWIALSGGR